MCESGAAPRIRDVLEIDLWRQQNETVYTRTRAHDAPCRQTNSCRGPRVLDGGYARVWAERASSIVDAPRTEVCQQPEAREKSHVAVALWL